ncbi:MAG: ABC transporter ATP-binding protein, partial [Nitrospirae bacterium]|nr:ABC transporter ATP-binding protein [Nitrospirota bacterium]
LDTHLSEKFMTIMRELQEKGKTLIIATHDPLVYERDYINLIFEMRDGMVKHITQRNGSLNKKGF